MITDGKYYYALLFSVLLTLFFIVLGGIVIHFYLISLESNLYIDLYMEAMKTWGVIILLIGVLTFFRVRAVLEKKENMRSLRLKKSVIRKMLFLWKKL